MIKEVKRYDDNVTLISVKNINKEIEIIKEMKF